jgi:hypothetical protein
VGGAGGLGSALAPRVPGRFDGPQDCDAAGRACLFWQSAMAHSWRHGGCTKCPVLGRRKGCVAPCTLDIESRRQVLGGASGPWRLGTWRARLQADDLFFECVQLAALNWCNVMSTRSVARCQPAWRTRRVKGAGTRTRHNVATAVAPPAPLPQAPCCCSGCAVDEDYSATIDNS